MMEGMLMRTAALWMLAAGALMAAGEVKVTDAVVRVTEAVATDGSGARYAFVDAEDPALKRDLVLAMNEEFKGQVYMQAQKNGPAKGPAVMVENRSGMMRHESAGSDFLVGVAMCVGACLFVQIAGDDMNSNEPPPDGLNVTAGDKIVSGGAAVVPCLLGAGGLFFMGKGIIEAFLPADSYGNLPVPKTTDQILAEGHVKRIQAVTFDADKLSREELKRQVLLYCVSTI
jgi:hypothetical protein